MVSGTSIDVSPMRKWSIEGFEYFWSTARDARLVEAVVWPDVTGRWPRTARPVSGREAYVGAISRFLDALPPFEVEVTDHAMNGDVAFVRWIISGRFAVGPDIMVGVDRLLLKDGFVLENHIHSDHPLFAKLAESALLECL